MISEYSLEMRSLSWIVSALMAAQAYAQGSLGGQQYPPCAAPEAAQYYGCWNISPSLNAGQAFYNLSIVGATILIAYYSGWVLLGGLYDDSVNPANCTTACRGHGYKFSALYNGQYGIAKPKFSSCLFHVKIYSPQVLCAMEMRANIGR
jgi:hypothetical protein